MLVVNVYSSPMHRKQSFRTLIQKAVSVVGNGTTVLCWDFNAPKYDKTFEKGRELLQDGTEARLALITDPAFPTRTGTSVARDTTPDLAFGVLSNTGTDLGSDHMIVEVRIPLGHSADRGKRKHKYPDWEEF